MKIALVHDQLQEFGGAERVLVALKQIFPEADVFTSFYNPQALGIHAHHFKDWNIITSWGDKIGLFKKWYSPLRFLTPFIWEPFNFNDYDLVISSSGSYMCKGIITKPNTKHICYLHHPPRYLYYYETAREWQKHKPIEIYGHIINHELRQWDYLSSQRVDHFIANSEETKKRIEKYYRRDSDVIYPPVTILDQSSLRGMSGTNDEEISLGSPRSARDDIYYITTSRLARAKHVDVLIKAANKHKFKLKVIGSGRDAENLKAMAGPTVEFLSKVTDAEFEELYKNAKGYLFASVDEEFGIAPVEALGYGIPVIAYASGGLLEIIKPGKNGYLYNELNEDSLLEKMKQFEKLSEKELLEMRKAARTSAEQYSFANFKKQILEFIKKH
ncbi:MAG TPA: glycosyltransferase [Candidatus Woesebacteria bacterium]|nr:glycosyltransferase [Candidatus Woesebacteria bacterium]